MATSTKTLISSLLLASGLTFANPAPVFESIGDGGFKADTTNSQAQKYFNQGMVLFYSFDFMEAIRSFEASLKLDPQCARCSFALALSLGSVTNAFIVGDEISKAQSLIAQTSTKDALTLGLLNALQKRYNKVTQSQSAADKNYHCAQAAIDLPAENKLAFSNALYDLSQQFPDDLTVKALFAFSILDTENWELYNTLLDIKPYTNMMVKACQEVLEKNPNHVGAIHLLIHATEWSKNPQVSLKYAAHLAQLAPLAEHLVHMPTHIYLRVGDYNQAVAQNTQAVQIYKEYEDLCKNQGFKPAVNFLNQHNYDYLFASAILAGREDVALQTAEQIRQATPVEWLAKSYNMQRFYALQYYAIAQFGSWQYLKPLDPSLEGYPYLKAMWAYAQALHAAVTHNNKDYEHYYQAFLNASEENDKRQSEQKEFINNLAIAKNILQATKARSENNWEQAIFHWYQATSLQKSAGDPPEWYFPTVWGLGYTFLDAGKPKQALATFEAALEQYPENGWALYGMKLAYQQLGLTEQAQEYTNRFNTIWDKKAVALPISILK